ncbi:MAG: CarD family transcriptional regulator [Cellulomonadaceae bacterium]|nr:CarD family transcriptional regulator [Cellulomonadaceae bacterium]
MSFEVGEVVIYPRHGAAVIDEIGRRTIKMRVENKLTEVEKIMLALTVVKDDMKIQVPADNVDLVGVRDVVDEEGLTRVFDALSAPYTEEPTNWSRRYKANAEKLGSGDVIKVAEVVRDLSRRDVDRGLSTGEKSMLAQARRILVSELALAENTDESQAAQRLDQVLAQSAEEIGLAKAA